MSFLNGRFRSNCRVERFESERERNREKIIIKDDPVQRWYRIEVLQHSFITPSPTIVQETRKHKMREGY